MRHIEWCKTPGGGHQGVGEVVELLQGIDTPGVDALPRGDKTPGVATKGNIITGGYGQRWGWLETPHHLSKQGKRSQRRQRRYGVRAKDSAVATPEGHGGRQQQRGPPAAEIGRRQQCKAQNGMHPRRKYGLLALEEPEGG